MPYISSQVRTGAVLTFRRSEPAGTRRPNGEPARRRLALPLQGRQRAVLVARVWLGYGWLNAGYQKLWAVRKPPSGTAAAPGSRDSPPPGSPVEGRDRRGVLRLVRGVPARLRHPERILDRQGRDAERAGHRRAANTFARESCIDELASAAGADRYGSGWTAWPTSGLPRWCGRRHAVRRLAMHLRLSRWPGGQCSRRRWASRARRPEADRASTACTPSGRRKPG